jgi:hypothetical protein
MADVLDQLAHGAADILCANADDHAPGLAIGLLCDLLVGGRLLLALAAAPRPGHCVREARGEGGGGGGESGGGESGKRAVSE